MANFKDVVSSEHEEQLETVPSQQSAELGTVAQRLDTVTLESQYHVSLRTYQVLLVMGIAWGTCTLANVGPSTTYSYAVAQLGGASKESWIPNAGLFPLIGLQPI
jgi:hypothetical protein